MAHQFFIKVHEDMPDHPKIEPLSDKAFRLLVETWCWCKRHTNDGRMAAASWARRGTPRSRGELEKAGLVDVEGATVLVHDYLDWQSSKAQIEAKQDAIRAGAVEGNHRRWHLARSAYDPNCPLCDPQVSGADRPTDSPPSRPPIGNALGDRVAPESTETETETEKEKTSSPAPRATVDDPEFDRFWEAYPRKVGKGEARKAWVKIRKAGIDAALIVAGAERYRDDPQRKDIAFTKHPGPWLNAERWTDQLNGNDLHRTTAWWDN
jgi:hypothetical protein